MTGVISASRDSPAIQSRSGEGRSSGGSSATNAAVAIRARSPDFDRWQSRGITGWSFDEVRETFRRTENTLSGEERWHGRCGPFPIRQPVLENLTPSCQAFVASALAAGLEKVDDFNGAWQHGVGPHPRNVLDGSRWNTAMAWRYFEKKKNNLNKMLLSGIYAYGHIANSHRFALIVPVRVSATGPQVKSPRARKVDA